MQDAYACGNIEFSDIQCRLDSWMTYASHANSYTLILRLSKDWTFQRAMTDQLSCDPRWQLEQQCQQLPGRQPQQQQSEQLQQQHRISCLPALFKEPAQNHRVYGRCERGVKSTGCRLELAETMCFGSRILLEPDRVGTSRMGDSIRLLKNRSLAA